MPARARRAIAALALALACVAMAAASDASAKIIADSGFRPAVDGFSFANYGGGYADLSANEVRLLFGRRACAFVTRSGRCVLGPPGQLWMELANRGMRGGHCQGFSVLSLLLFRRLYPAFGPGPTNRLRLRGNVALQRAIAYGFEFQAIPAVVDGSVLKATPNQVLRFLIAALGRRGGETYGMGIYQFIDGHKVGGHEITPYAVDQLSGGRYDVLLYDNNHPGVTRRLHINTRADSWSYQASTNPSEADSLYQGNARTKTLELDPTSPGLGIHPCPFCSSRGRPGAYNELQLQGSLSNHAHLLIVDAHRRRLGFANGRFVSEIPGGRAIWPRELPDWRERQKPIYRIPPNLDVTVTIDGRGLRRADTEQVSLIGPNHDVALESMRILPGEVNTLSIAAGAGSVSYRSAPGQRESPSFDIGLVGTRSDFRLVVKALGLNPDSVVNVAADQRRRRLTFGDLASKPQTFRVTVTRYAQDQVQVLRTLAIRLAPGRTESVPYAALR